MSCNQRLFEWVTKWIANIVFMWGSVLEFLRAKDLTGSLDRFQFVAETNLPTTRGVYRVRSYRSFVDNLEPVAIIFGRVESQDSIPLRVHDQCFTSEVLGSKKCDCKEQLDYSMDYVRSHGPGLIIYLQQEGRGIGLANKIAAYSLQEEGHDTVEANRLLGLSDDSRTYESVKFILDDLRISSVELLTNNPRKIEELSKLKIRINKRVPVQIPPNSVNFSYLSTKAKKMSHFLEDSLTPISLDPHVSH